MAWLDLKTPNIMYLTYVAGINWKIMHWRHVKSYDYIELLEVR